MKQVRGIVLLAVTLILPMVHLGDVSAASEPIIQEIQVTAAVPHHRDIVIDRTGKIVEIFSNTTEDVKPSVYIDSVAPKNKKPLTDKLYKQYRRHVPVGTAEYGILYQRNIPLSLLRGDYMGLQNSLRRNDS